MMTRIMLTILLLPVWSAVVAALAWFTLVWLVSKAIKQTEAAQLSLEWILSLDLHANALAFGNKRNYISTRAGLCARKGGNRPCYWLCRMLHFFQRNHCEKSIEIEGKS